ncbi:MAG: hypothetical protein OHK0039_39320 [Bacteroidia bacterium]
MSLSTRRQFLGTSLAAAGGLVLPRSVSQLFAPSDTLRLGVIGTGGRGCWAVQVAQEQPGIEVVACCDTYTPHLEKGLALAAPQARSYTDYRYLLEQADIDAVVVATPLHLHAPMVLDALDAGKHVYCEKTMTYDIASSLAVVARARTSGRILQVGYQNRVNPLFHRVSDIIRKGYIGPVKFIQCTWNRNGNWRRTVPDPSLEHQLNWRMYTAYSGGLLAELSSHQLDIVNWVLGAHPLAVAGAGGISFWQDGRETFDHVSATYSYPEGVKAHFTCLTTNAHESFSMLFYGTKATIEVKNEQGQIGLIYPEPVQGANDTAADAVSGATKEALASGEPIPLLVPDPGEDDRLPTGNAFGHFAACIRDGQTPLASVEVGHYAGVAVHMGNLALRNNRIETWQEAYDV